MKPKSDLAYQRQRPRFRRNSPSGVAKPGNSENASGTGPADASSGDEDDPTNKTMEARSLEAEAAYEFAAQHNEATDRKPAEPAPAEGERAPAQPQSRRDHQPQNRREDAPAQPAPTDAPTEDGQPAAPVDPQAQRREQERMRREAEREKRDNERRDRERREQERRDQQRREQERRERDRLMELRNLDVDSIVSKAWDIFGAEVKEEGVELFPDNDARELAKRAFRLAEIFLLEESRLRRLRAEPLPGEGSNNETNSGNETPSEGGSEATPATETAAAE